MRFGLVGLVVCLLSAACAAADFSCTAAVSYQWKREGQDAKSVAWSELRSSAEKEDAAKAQLAKQIAVDLPRARAECIKRHENLAGCIAAKFSAKSSLLAGLGFSARKALEEAISADCKALQGACLEAAAGPPVCVESKKAEEPPPVEGKEEQKGKGAGEEKKKKK